MSVHTQTLCMFAQEKLAALSTTLLVDGNLLWRRNTVQSLLLGQRVQLFNLDQEMVDMMIIFKAPFLFFETCEKYISFSLDEMPYSVITSHLLHERRVMETF